MRDRAMVHASGLAFALLAIVEAGDYQKMISAGAHSDGTRGSWQKDYTSQYAGSYKGFMSWGGSDGKSNVPPYASGYIGSSWRGYTERPLGTEDTAASANNLASKPLVVAQNFIGAQNATGAESAESAKPLGVAQNASGAESAESTPGAAHGGSTEKGGDYQKFMSAGSHSDGARGSWQNIYTSQYAGKYSGFMSSGGSDGKSNLPPFASGWVGGWGQYTDRPTSTEDESSSPSSFIALPPGGQGGAPADQQTSKGGDEVAAAQKAAAAAVQLASDRVAGVEALASELESNLKSKEHAAGIADVIISKALRDFKDRREDAEHAFQIGLQALNDTQLQSASEEGVKAAIDAASKADENLARLQHAEIRAARSGLRGMRRAVLVGVREMRTKARDAAHRARRAQDAVSISMRKAGAREAAYEHVQAHAEEVGDHLRDQAEAAAERAQGIVEEQFAHVERELHLREGALNEALEQERIERKLRMKEATEAVAQARAAHGAVVARIAEGAATAAKGMGETGSASRSAARRGQAAFLAGAPTPGLMAGLTLPAACGILMAAAMSFLLSVVLSRTRVARIGELPALG